jgi:hypothetical protein
LPQEERIKLINRYAENIPIIGVRAEQEKRLREVMKEWFPRTDTDSVTRPPMDVPPAEEPFCLCGDPARFILSVKGIEVFPTLPMDVIAAAVEDGKIHIARKFFDLPDSVIAGVLIKEFSQLRMLEVKEEKKIEDATLGRRMLNIFETYSFWIGLLRFRRFYSFCF